MTSVPCINAEVNSSAKQDDEFLEEIGYAEFVKSFSDEGDPNLTDLFSRLQSKADECKVLKQMTDELEAKLSIAREETAAANAKDAVQQRECAAAVEQIREIEERAGMIENALIPKERQWIQEMEATNDKLRQKIAQGPGWTENQENERVSLATLYEQSQEEVTDLDVRMAQLKEQVRAEELKVESSVKSRDELNSQLDLLEQDIMRANQLLLAEKERVFATSERNKVAIEVSLKQVNSDLKDLCNKRDEAKEDGDRIANEVESIRATMTTVSKDHNSLVKSHEITVDELTVIRRENAEINGVNNEMSKSLEQKRAEHHELLKQRAKLAKMRELIENKVVETEEERKALEKEMTHLNIDTANMENELPMIAKENESIRRQIKRFSMELEVISRKTDLTKRGARTAKDLSKSHESTIKTQENEITGKSCSR